MANLSPWFEGVPVSITVTDRQGNIREMNARAREAFAFYGGGQLVGKNVFDCHPEPARIKTEELYREQAPNHYTVQKGGVRKIIHQLPWYENDEFAGYVEISIAIPETLPHFERA
jgi:PAS domain S-box-containing protein